MSEATARIEQIDDQRREVVTRKRIDTAQQWLIWWIDTEKLQFTAAAKMLSLGEDGRNVVSAFYQKTLESDPARLVNAIEAYRRQTEGEGGVTKFIGYRDTRCSRLLIKYAMTARDGRAIGLLVGPYGAGKTEALRRLEQRARGDGGPPVKYIFCRINTHLSALIKEVAEATGVIGPGGKGDAARLHKDIANRLKSRPVFLVFDEADRLTRRCLEFIRDLHDESGVGSLIVGRPGLLDTIEQGAAWKTLDEEDRDKLMREGPLAPLIDRIFFVALPGLHEREITEITEDIMKAELTGEASAALLAHVGHSFRLLAKMIARLREVKVKGTRTIDQPKIEEAWSLVLHYDLKK